MKHKNQTNCCLNFDLVKFLTSFVNFLIYFRVFHSFVFLFQNLIYNLFNRSFYYYIFLFLINQDLFAIYYFIILKIVFFTLLN